MDAYDIYLKNIPAQMPSDPIWNGATLGFCEKTSPQVKDEKKNKNRNKNKMRNYMRSVPDP